MSKLGKNLGIAAGIVLLALGGASGVWYYLKHRHAAMPMHSQIISLAPFVLNIPGHAGGATFLDVEISLGIKAPKIIDKKSLDAMLPRLRATLLSVMLDFPNMATLPYSARSRESLTTQIVQAAGPMFGKKNKVTGAYITKIVEQ